MLVKILLAPIDLVKNKPRIAILGDSFAYGFDMQGNTISASEGILTQISFTNWQGDLAAALTWKHGMTRLGK